MSASERSPGRRVAWSLLVVIPAASWLAGCDEIVSRPWPVPNEMQVLLILDPEADTQAAMVNGLAGGTPIPHLSGTVRSGHVVVAQDTLGGETTPDEFMPCHETFGSPLIVLQTRCMPLAFTPVGGVEYEAEFSAPGRPTIRGRTVVPEPFAILDFNTTGAPPGGFSLDATWSSSAGAYRYVVAIQGDRGGNQYCYPDTSCFRRWMATTSDTTISATLDAGYFEGAQGPWQFTVYAMSEELYAYLMTNDSNDFFPVTPIHNVEGGYGVVGSWVIRRVAIP